MLITNFSSGELSKTLYGRIDLPQYARGAAILENFDVIPTGGIKRRGGMERLFPLAGGGRLIPFIANRDLCFLLYLTPGAVRVYRVEDGEVIPPAEDEEPITGVGGKALYAEGEIAEVQYAQDYNTMILVHENHAPIEVVFKNGGLFFTALKLDFKVPVVAGNIPEGENISDSEKGRYEKDDERYADNGLLASDGNYPRCVSFFNGRLAFAGTKNSPQRIFFSSVKEDGRPYNFATKKVFIEPKREYVTVHATVLEAGKLQIAMPEIAINFLKPINQYYIDSIYFPKGTRIAGLVGDEMQLDPPITSYVFNELRITNEMIDKKDAYTTAEGKDGSGYYNQRLKVGSLKYKYQVPDPPSGFDLDTRPDYHEEEYYIYYGANNIHFVYWTRDSRTGFNGTWGTNNDSKVEKTFSSDIASKSDEYIRSEIAQKFQEGITFLQNKLNEVKQKVENGHQRGQNSTWGYSDYSFSFNAGNIETIKDNLFTAITETMKYRLHSEDEKWERWYYDLPEKYIPDILPFLRATQNIYVSFYTREIIKDEYPTPDCGFTFELASDMNDAIRWLAVNKGLVVGTESAEWVIPPGVHATNAQATLNSRHGSDRIQGTAIGDAVCFFQNGRKGLVEYYIPQADNHFRANNMAMLAPQMLRESRAKEFDFASSPYTRLYITREDGVMATLLYERGTGTFAWNRITTGPEVVIDHQTEEDKKRLKEIREADKKSSPYSYNNGGGLLESFTHLERVPMGRILSAAVLPGPDGFDDLYLVVRRGDGLCLERLREEGAVYLDCWREWKWKTEFTPEEEAEGMTAEGERKKLIDEYGGEDGGAVVYDEKANRTYKLNEKPKLAPDEPLVTTPDGRKVPYHKNAKWIQPEPLPPVSDEEHPRYIGYPYTSLMRSMPVVKDAKMGHVNIKGLSVRFDDSCMPKTREPRRMAEEGMSAPDGKEPYTGVSSTNIIAGATTTAQFDILHKEPTRCRVLSVYAEV